MARSTEAALRRRARRTPPAGGAGWVGIGRLLLLALAVASGACGDRDSPERRAASGDVRVTEIELGRAAGPDGRITAESATDDFRVGDTVHVAVQTEGRGRGSSLTARWLDEEGRVVDETTRTLSPAGPVVTGFHLPTDGLPAGSYRIEILLDGASTDGRDFHLS
jgi:hypothetical protein